MPASLDDAVDPRTPVIAGVGVASQHLDQPGAGLLCGYEMAMLTNAYETQVVQSLGVRIGPASDAGASSTSGTKCPFSGMIPATDGEQPGPAAEPIPVRWTAAAEARLGNIPEFVRPMARTGIERFAREKGSLEVDEKILDEARDFFGM
jgi:hypothetical protein